jgi:hypothetical protein
MFADPERYNRARRLQIHLKAKRQNEILESLDEELSAVPINGSTTTINRFDFWDSYTPQKE